MLDEMLPSSASFAVPLNVTGLPALNAAPFSGVVMMIAGGVLALATMV